MALYRLRKQLLGKFAVLLCMQLLADDVSRVHVHDQIEILILPSHFGMEPGDVPTPYLVRSSRRVLGTLPVFHRSAGRAAGILTLGPLDRKTVV